MNIVTANQGIALFEIVRDASVLVQLVLLLLLLASLLSWTMIFRKWFMLKAAGQLATGFERRFWSGGNLSQMYKELSQNEEGNSGMDSIFVAGFKEFARLEKQKNIEPMDILAGAQRAMRVALSREIEDLETSLSFLATVGSTSPYVGLFGTVWGIMNAFHALGALHQVTIANVAPGISEALITTAMGLFAAIPAVVAYNRYSHDVERLVTRYEVFSEEFSNILQRQAFLAKA